MERTDENIGPAIDPEAFIAEGAVILGDVSIGKDCSVWYHTTIRADRAPVYIGELVIFVKPEPVSSCH